MTRRGGNSSPGPPSARGCGAPRDRPRAGRGGPGWGFNPQGEGFPPSRPDTGTRRSRARIPAKLEARRYQADLSAVLEISDDALGGGGRFALNIRNGRARCVPSNAIPDVNTDLSVLGSIYLGGHHASAFAAANRLRCNEPALPRHLDIAFATEVPAELGYGF